MHKILIVEDDDNMAALLAEFLTEEPYSILHEPTGQGALDAIFNSKFDAILLDLRLPDMEGFEILKEIKNRSIPSAVIVITGQGSMTNAVEAMKLGARDFLVKPTDKQRLITTIKNALETQELHKVIEVYKNKIDRKDYGGFIGSCLPMQEVYRIIDSAANSKASVFITGESGTGKEVCAEAIHEKGPRKGKTFCAINCAAIPRDLMESEIFGHVKGAFTGANSDRDGAASRADGGTLFLDEIGEMDLDLQTKLLRFVQTGKFMRIGDSKEISVDVRIICATNRDPAEEIENGRFRKDLYYRLHVLPIHMPPLRDRGEDILDIAEFFLKKHTEEENKSFQGFDEDTKSFFLNYDWPGNVRELQNVVRNIVVLNDSEYVSLSQLPSPLNTIKSINITHDIIKDYIEPPTPEKPANSDYNAYDKSPSNFLGQTPDTLIKMDELERMAIENAIEVCDGSILEVAHYLGISAATIYRKKSAWKKD